MTLTQTELRVLGSLIEKEITTPDLYPLSLNALQAASNQRSSREPVLDLSEDDLRIALNSLETHGLASPARSSLNTPAGRVPKFEHHARSVFNLRRDETALLCLLLLRGPQTPGELRSRSERLFPFDDLPSVTDALDRMADPTRLPVPLVAILPRQPGARESRYTHLLGHTSTPTQTAPESTHPTLAQLEARIATLERRLSHLEAQLQPTTPSQTDQ